MTRFSDFIRNASDADKEKVYLGVIDKAIERQKTHTTDGCDLSILTKNYSVFRDKIKTLEDSGAD